ncbi:amino acid adenylation domain-containing protein [Allokutzneria oryzae]|uniref:Amino acid adenylation domain-containing protein n=1 Tax=Allokutzneria oryzae TaxID=1378989 RepID=A0ABV6A110_9PSEU
MTVALTDRQRRMWLRNELEPALGLETARALRLHGPLDGANLVVCLERIVARHPALRTRYPSHDGEPTALVENSSTMDFEASESTVEGFPEELVRLASHPFDLAAAPVLRVRLLTLAEDDHVLLVVVHPIAATRAFLGRFLAELGAELAGDPPPAFPTSGPVAARQRQLPEQLPRLDLAAPGASRTGAGSRVTTQLNVPTPAVFLSAIALLLRRYTGVGVMALGLPVAVGDTENPVPLLVDLEQDRPVSTALRDVAEALSESLAHKEVPYETLLREHGSVARFEVSVVIDDLVLDGLDDPSLRAFALGEDGAPLTAGALSLRPVALPRGGTPCELEIVLSLRENRISWLSGGHALPEPLLADLSADLLTVLSEMLEAPDTSTVDLLTRARGDRTPVLDRDGPHAQHPGYMPFPADTASIAHRFAEVCQRFPDSTAVLTDSESLTYSDLAARAAATANLLRSGSGPVGLLLPHGPAQIVAIVAAVLTGRPYVPLDARHPADRLAAILEHAGATTLLSDPDHDAIAATLPVPNVHHLSTVDTPLLAEDITASGDSLAYVLYTSGSTGQPKAVTQTHANVLFQVRNHVDNFRISPTDRVSLLSSFGFDMAVTDLFSALLSGAAVVPFDVSAHGVSALARVLVERGVTVYHSTPTMFRYLTGSLGERSLPAMRAVLLGGEQVRRDDVERARKVCAADCVFVNGYGATEISFVTQHHLGPDAPVEDEVIPVGRRLPGVEVVLLDPAGRRACLRGEITVRSDHVAPGYWRDPAATAEKFVTVGGAPAYRTGDIARRLPDGTLVHLGRADRQVKVRGYRVEPGEIEAALCALPTVAQAVAVAGPTEIIAYVVPNGARPEPGPLLDALARTLPHYMLPREVVVLDSFPLTRTGKVDVRALPAPQRARAARPTGDVPEAVARVWSAVLGVPEPAVDADFFALGGHSAQVPRVKRLLEAELNVEIPLARLFDHPTITALTRFLSAERPTATPAFDRVGDRMARRDAVRAGRRPR